VWSSVAAQLRDPLLLVLLAASVLTLATGDFVDAGVIAIVVAANTTVGMAQELRADRAVSALSRLTAPTVRVRRDGSEARVDAASLVPGDIVLLGEGDVVPADGVVLEAAALLVDEAALLGGVGANPALPLSAVTSLLLALAGIYALPLRDLLGTHTIPAQDAVVGSSAGIIGC
jgi:high-affinity K+ transport system ATPase subunit B